MRALLTAALILLPLPGVAGPPDTGGIVDRHILPGFHLLARRSADLAETAAADCDAHATDLRAAYGAAFDAWVGVSHLRFGPSEEENRAFALAFWPDPRGAGPKALARLLQDEATTALTPAAYREVSVAARGFYALELVLYDAQLASMGMPRTRCALLRLMTADIASTAAQLAAGWDDHAGAMRAPGPEGPYRDAAEVARQLFTALSTGLEFTSSARLGRPLGSFDKPRPRRAEARRSERSLRHVILSLEATRDLAAGLSGQDPALLASFDRALETARRLDDPAFAGVAEPAARFKVESLQRAVDQIRQAVAEDLAPALGVAAGFNSLDGD